MQDASGSSGSRVRSVHHQRTILAPWAADMKANAATRDEADSRAKAAPKAAASNPFSSNQANPAAAAKPTASFTQLTAAGVKRRSPDAGCRESRAVP